MSNLNCDCDRGVFSASITRNFGNIFYTAIFGGVAGAMTVFGSVAAFSYRRRKKHVKMVNNTNNTSIISDREILIRYSVMMLAIGAGIVHLSIYSEHGSLRIEYGIFLLAAASAQFAYGIVYVIMTLSNELDSITSVGIAKMYYKRSVIVNLVGLIGSSVLLGLYFYSVVLPPPLSPTNTPEAVDIAGILDKSLEMVLVIGILYVMRLEKKRITKLLLKAK